MKESLCDRQNIPLQKPPPLKSSVLTTWSFLPHRSPVSLQHQVHPIAPQPATTLLPTQVDAGNGTRAR